MVGVAVDVADFAAAQSAAKLAMAMESGARASNAFASVLGPDQSRKLLAADFAEARGVYPGGPSPPDPREWWPLLAVPHDCLG